MLEQQLGPTQIGHANMSPRPPTGSALRPPRLEVISGEFARAGSEDAALVEALRRGDPEASKLLWDRYYTLVRGLLRRYFGPHHDVEDHVQEVFLRLFRKLDALRDESALRSYIVGITMRVIRSEMRKHAIRTRLWWDYTQKVGYEQAALQGAAADEVQRLATILDRVSSKVRFIFLMRYVEELSLPEIAEALRVSLATAKRRVRSATDVVLKQAKSDPVLERYLYDAQADDELAEDEPSGRSPTAESHTELRAVDRVVGDHAPLEESQKLPLGCRDELARRAERHQSDEAKSGPRSRLHPEEDDAARVGERLEKL